MFELRFRCTDITALQPYLHDSGAFRKEAARHTTKKTTVHITTPRISLSSAEYGTLARRLPLQLTTTSNSHQLLPAARHHLSKRGSHADVNALCEPANCPSGGRNRPYVPLTMSHPNYSIMSPNGASTRSLMGVHASAPIAHITARHVLKIVSPHSSRRMPCNRHICSDLT